MHVNIFLKQLILVLIFLTLIIFSQKLVLAQELIPITEEEIELTINIGTFDNKITGNLIYESSTFRALSKLEYFIIAVLLILILILIFWRFNSINLYN